MRLDDTPEEAAFRAEVRAFIDKERPQAGDGAGAGGDDIARAVSGFMASQGWFKKLSDRGWIVPAWPKEYGGGGMTVMQQFIFNEEMALARAPRPMHLIIAAGMAGPTIIVHGSDYQKETFLPGIARGEDIWCQLYSEPGAGSDLASLQTRAVRDGDDYVINGSKIWTTMAHMAKYAIMLARTDPEAPKHRGISYFILDMKTPGITINPLVNMGGTHEFNQVFFEDVRIPKENLVGEENRGWYVGVTTLDFERSSIGSSIGARQNVEGLVQFAKENAGSPITLLNRSPLVRMELADRLVETEVGQMLSYRVISMQNRGMVPNHEASLLKLYTTEMNQRIARTGMKLIGLYGTLGRGEAKAPRQGGFAGTFIRSIANTIEGGTSEVQRNVVAQRGLGLPRD
jgi:alkylation response protein AidB-like acyl-CoA dehydrogenase